MLCLTYSTDPSWAETAANDLPTLLSDHAHCEMKAASNALSLAARWPSIPRLVRALAAIAEEELRHFRAVLAELERRGIPLGKPEVDEYAALLRKAAPRTHAPGASAGEKARGGSARAGRAAPSPPQTAMTILVDRLLVGALIEARSCERFRLLTRAFEARGETQLAAFYEELFAAEANHYMTFVELAADVAGDEPHVKARLRELAIEEGALAANLGLRPTMHG